MRWPLGAVSGGKPRGREEEWKMGDAKEKCQGWLLSVLSQITIWVLVPLTEERNSGRQPGLGGQIEFHLGSVVDNNFLQGLELREWVWSHRLGGRGQQVRRAVLGGCRVQAPGAWERKINTVEEQTYVEKFIRGIFNKGCLGNTPLEFNILGSTSERGQVLTARVTFILKIFISLFIPSCPI